MAFPARRWYHRFFRWYGGTRVGVVMNRRMLPVVDRWMLRRSDGRRSLSGMLTGWPVVPVTARGRKSGKLRTVPLLVIPDRPDTPDRADRILLIASNFGRPKHPVWYRNISANPDVTLSWPDGDRAYVAHEAEGDEREELWQVAVDAYAGYAQYARRTTRTIPVLVLTPVSPE